MSDRTGEWPAARRRKVGRRPAHPVAVPGTMSAAAIGLLLLLAPAAAGDSPADNARMPAGDAELRYWLENMVWYHGFDVHEVSAATGLSALQVATAERKLGITPATRPHRAAAAPLLVLPYPGGRHPRVGFREGAVRPQRETKFSVFPPWDGAGYVVVDLPEALWSNLGLLYLAHTHVPTLWSKQRIQLSPLEWRRRPGGALEMERRLPNGIVFGANVVPTRQAVRMELWLTNGTRAPLTDLRVQVCVLLGRAAGFETQTGDNKVFVHPYAACRSADGARWVITAWEPHHRGWGNPRCPCLHSDPKFPDCGPGETRRVRGWLSFYAGSDVASEFRRIDQTNWRGEPHRGRTPAGGPSSRIAPSPP